MAVINSPNYTQIPNALLGDLLAGDVVSPGLISNLEGAEVKIFLVICRLTFGYHRAEKRASLTMIQQMTGLSRQGVVNSAKVLERLNLIERSIDGGLTLWRVKVNSVDQQLVNSVDRAVNSVDQQRSTQLTSAVNSVDQSGQLSLPPSKKETRKKPRKKKLEKNNGVGVGVDENDFAQLRQIYEAEFGAITPNVALILADELQTYPLDWITQAVEISVMNDKRVWSYVRGVLRRWAEAGGPTADEGSLPFTDELPEAEPKSEIEQQWDQAKSELRSQMTQATYDSQIARCQLRREKNHYVVLAPTLQNVEMLENRLRGQIERTLSRVTNDPAPEVRFGVA